MGHDRHSHAKPNPAATRKMRRTLLALIALLAHFSGKPSRRRTALKLTHNVLIVVTEHGSAYAFDPDSVAVFGLLP